jgi:hypothetical protein
MLLEIHLYQKMKQAQSFLKVEIKYSVELDESLETDGREDKPPGRRSRAHAFFKRLVGAFAFACLAGFVIGLIMFIVFKV